MGERVGPLAPLAAGRALWRRRSLHPTPFGQATVVRLLSILQGRDDGGGKGSAGSASEGGSVNDLATLADLLGDVHHHRRLEEE